ncbi:hypothetical protein C7M84_017582 [Penaeus vannamei]|uniref:Fibrinogen C-terminal domain-containing protein n=1 Tax=Penaeus vannamei TaxID=6689 RepID=A0A423SJX2_PENVA|nr:hypothetical protein C7M84_017582 [Penaeus vannamei]
MCFQALCHLSEEPADSGWTLAFKQTAGSDKFHNNVLGSTAYTMHENGIYDVDSPSYSIGLKKLVAMNRNEDGSRRPLTFLFIIRSTDGTKYHASYNGVNIGDASTRYELEEIGEYHGTAGDSFQKNLGNTFQHYGGAGGHFWAPPAQFDARQGVYLTFSIILWETLTNCPSCGGFTPDWVKLYVRPKSWDEVAVDMPISRAPGTNITYSCVGDMMMEGSADGQRTAAGVMQCLEASDGSLAWDWIPTLPCTFACPDGFTEAPRGGVCYHFSTDVAEFGFASALVRCNEMGATLAKFDQITDLDNAAADQCYYSTYIKRTDDSTQPWRLNSQFTCDPSERCQLWDNKNQCIMICNPGKFRVEDCATPSPYACVIPALCPPYWDLAGDMCYRFQPFGGSYLDAVHVCHNNGGGLAVPKNPKALFDIGELAKSNETGRPPSVSVDTPKTSRRVILEDNPMEIHLQA